MPRGPISPAELESLQKNAHETVLFHRYMRWKAGMSPETFTAKELVDAMHMHVKLMEK